MDSGGHGGEAAEEVRVYEILLVAFLFAFLWAVNCHLVMKRNGGWRACCEDACKVLKRWLDPGRWLGYLGRSEAWKAKAAQRQRVQLGVLWASFLMGLAGVLYFVSSLSGSFHLSHHLAVGGAQLTFILVYLASETWWGSCLLPIPYHLCMLSLAAHVMPWARVDAYGEGDGMMQLHFLACLFRFVALPVATTIHSVIFWSGLVSGFVWYRSPEIGQMDVLFSVTTIVGFWWLERSVELAAALQVEMADLESVRQACHKLLSAVCDAVVELDESLCITEDVHRLGTWLLHGKQRVAQGKEVRQLMHSTLDWETFAAEVGRENHASSMAAAFHLKMRAGNGTVIPAECFHAKFHFGCQERHLLAFRDFSDSVMPAVPSQLEASVDQKLSAGDVPVVEFDGLDFSILSASPAFFDAFPVYLYITDYIPESSHDAFLQDMNLHCNEFLNSFKATSDVEMTIPLLAKCGARSCFCRLSLHRRDFHPQGKEDSPSSRHCVGQDLNLIIKLSVWKMKQHVERRGRTTLRGSRSLPTRRLPESGDLRALPSRRRSLPGILSPLQL